jgi:hypothetical protein
MPVTDARRGVRQVALGQAEDPKAVVAQAKEHVRIRIVLNPVFRSEVGRPDSRQQAQGRRSTSSRGILTGTEQERIKAGRRVAGEVHATACVFAFVHNGASPSRAWEFQRAGLLGIIHGRGFRFVFWFPGFGLFFGFGHKFPAGSEENAQVCFTCCCACAVAARAGARQRASSSGFRSKYAW